MSQYSTSRQKNTREKSSARLNFRFESKPISQVLFLGFVFNSRDALLVESWCLNWNKTLYLHAAVCRLTLQCSASAVHHISPATELPEHPRVNIFLLKMEILIWHAKRQIRKIMSFIASFPVSYWHFCFWPMPYNNNNNQ